MSTYSDSLHRIPRSGRSSEGTGTILYASLRSSFASKDPSPRPRMSCTASSIDAYLIEHWARSMPSFTLWPSGEDRSTIRRHLLGRLRLGITPIGLIWRWGKVSAAASGKRTTRFRSTSWAVNCPQGTPEQPGPGGGGPTQAVVEYQLPQRVWNLCGLRRCLWVKAVEGVHVVA